MKKFSVLSVVALLVASSAFADLESMKARVPIIVSLKEKGEVGEKPDGLLGVIKGDAKVQAIVDAENKDRMEVYTERATSQGQDLATLMKVLGDARLRSEKAGRMIQDASGTWVRKD
jgi:uncharacterized protein YdbL (DUF1318 family)